MSCLNNKSNCVQPFRHEVQQKSKRHYHDDDLHQLAQNGKYNQIKDAILKIPSKVKKIVLNKKDEIHNTPLHYAATYHHYDVCQLLIENEADINAKGLDDKTPLHLAVQYSSELEEEFDQNLNVKIQNILRLFLNSGATANSKDKHGSTPLHFASQHENFSCVDLLLQHDKVDINAKDNEEKTALHFACHSGRVETVSNLLKKGANLFSEDENNETPIMLAVAAGRLEVIELLVDRCCKSDRNKLLSSVNKKSGMSLIHMAIAYGHKDVLDFFLQHCKDWEYNNVMEGEQNYYNKLLHVAAEKGELDLLKFLIKNGAEINEPNKVNRTPIFLAAQNNHVKVVEFLIKNKEINIEAKDLDGKSIIHFCAEKGRNKILQDILKNRKEQLKRPVYEKEKTELTFAKVAGIVTTVKKFAKKNKLFINSIDVNGNSPLHLAALHGKDLCVQTLMEFGANVHARNITKKTPLMCAINKKTCKALLKAGAFLDSEDDQGNTALHHACRNGFKPIVELLIKKGANVTHLSKDGKNALDHAIDAGRESCAMLLINHDEWKKVLRNKIVVEKGFIETPMRKLIKKMPNLALEVFQKCTTTNGKNKNDKEYRVVFNHEFLDDEFSSDNWSNLESGSDFESNLFSSKSFSKNNKLCVKKKEVNDEKNFGINVYTTDSTGLRKNHPLYLMLNPRNPDLLTHPLVISLINHLWKSYGKPLYYINFLIYVIFMVSLNVYALTLPPPFALNTTTTFPPYQCVQVRLEAQSAWGSDCLVYPTWRTVVTVLVLLFSGLGLLIEAAEIASYRVAYIKNFANFIQLGAYISAITLVIDLSELGSVTGIRQVWQWQIGAIAVFLSWMGLIVFMKNFPTFGVYIETVFQNTKSFLLFFLVLICFVVGFASSFFLVFQNKIAFSSWFGSLVKTFSMMLGEFDYEGIFNAQNRQYIDVVIYPLTSFLMYIIFLMLLGIIIVNLLVGLAVGDVTRVNDHALLERLTTQRFSSKIAQARLSLRMKYAIPHRLRKRVSHPNYEFCPNKNSEKNLIVQWLNFEENLSQDAIDKIFNAETYSVDLEDKINKIQDEVSRIYKLLDDQSNYLKVIAKKKAQSSTLSDEYKMEVHNEDF